MPRIKSFHTVGILLSFFLVFLYLTLNQESTDSVKASLKDRHVQNSSEQESWTTTHSHVQTNSVSLDTMDFDVHDFSVSEGFRQLIPQSGAYWNRLLSSALNGLNYSENPLRNETPWFGCMQDKQELLQTNVHDYHSYPALFKTFLEGMDCKYPPVLIDQPNKCSPRDSPTFLLFAIKSNPRNFERRQAVRETWGREGVHQNGLRVKIVFLLGSTSANDPDLSVLLAHEAKHFRDLLQWDFHDSFFNLTLKMSVFLRWTLMRCPQVSFVFSGDDDVFVNTPLLLTYLQSREAPMASQLYVGHVINTASPHRDPRNKYYIPESFYDGPYPAYAGGGGFVFSGALLKRLYLASHVIPFYPIDDVYVGMLAKALDISAEAHIGFQTFDIRQQDRANVCAHKSLILVHQRSPQETKWMWGAMHSPLLTC